MADTQFSLPVPHIYSDGSVSTVTVHKYDEHDWVTIRDDVQSIIVASPEQARAMARALTIAADLMVK